MARTPFFGRGPAPQIARMDMAAATAPGRSWRETFKTLGDVGRDVILDIDEKRKKKEAEEDFRVLANQLPMETFSAFGITDEEERNAFTDRIAKNPKVRKDIFDLLNFQQQQEAVNQRLEAGRVAALEKKTQKEDAKAFREWAFTRRPGQLPPEAQQQATDLRRFDPRSRDFATGGAGPMEPGRSLDPSKFVEIARQRSAVESTRGPSKAPIQESPDELLRLAIEEGLSPGELMQAYGVAQQETVAAGKEIDLRNKIRFAEFEAELKNRSKAKGGQSGTLVVNDAIRRTDELLGKWTTGIGSWLSALPGTDAKALGALFKTIKANIGFDKLQAMKAASPTGGALGQVSDKEIAFLQAVFGNLDQAQSEEMLRYNIQLLQHVYNNVVHGEGNHPYSAPGQAGFGQPESSEAEKQRLIKLYETMIDKSTGGDDDPPRPTAPVATPREASYEAQEAWGGPLDPFIIGEAVLKAIRGK